MRTRRRCQQARRSRVPSRDPGGAWDLTASHQGCLGPWQLHQGVSRCFAQRRGPCAAAVLLPSFCEPVRALLWIELL